jgi:hypothetical protein
VSEKGVFCYACNEHGRTTVGILTIDACRWCFGTGRRFDGPGYLQEQERYERELNYISDEQNKRDFSKLENE